MEYKFIHQLEMELLKAPNFIERDADALCSLERIKKEILNINKTIYDFQQNEKIKEDLNNFLQGTISVYDLFDKYSSDPIFHIVSIELLANKIKEMTNKQLSDFVNLCRARYEYINDNNFLPELANLQTLIDELKLDDSNNVKKFHLKRLKELLRNVIERVK